MPDIADRHRDPEFPSAGLRSRGIQHPRSEDAAAGDRWDRVGKTPSGSIARAPTRPHSSRRWCHSLPLRERREASKHRTAPTSPAQRLATSLSKPGRATVPLADRPRSSSMTSDIAKTPAAGVLDEIVLAALALAMDLHLGLGVLSQIHDRLAAQDRRRQGISVRHRQSPSGTPPPGQGVAEAARNPSSAGQRVSRIGRGCCGRKGVLWSLLLRCALARAPTPVRSSRTRSTSSATSSSAAQAHRRTPPSHWGEPALTPLVCPIAKNTRRQPAPGRCWTMVRAPRHRAR